MDSWAIVIVSVAGMIWLGVVISLALKKDALKMQLKAGQNVDGKVMEELTALKQQIAELRDTTTRYDMSFDSALQRIESRVGHEEGRVNGIEEGQQQVIGR